MKRLLLTLTTTDNVTAEQQLLPEVTPMKWSEETDAPTDVAFFEILDEEGVVQACVTITGDAWRALESEYELDEVVRHVREGSDLEDAIRAELDLYEMTYAHCEEWTDEWNCMVDSECPTCGTDCSPRTAVQLRGLVPTAGEELEAFNLCGTRDEAPRLAA